LAVERTDRTKILQRIADGEYLPSPSPVLLRLLKAAADEHTSASDLGAIIELDPGLTTRLIKMANSAFYSRGRTVSSVSQAILVIGFSRLRVMALTLSLRDSFPMGKVGRMNYEYFWKTSLYRAFIALGFARSIQTREKLPDEEVFTAALILEIGLLMLYHLCPEALKESFPDEEASLEENIVWEEEHLGINHREIGRVVLKRWHFPEHITETQQYFGSEALVAQRSFLCKIIEYSRSFTQIFFGNINDFGSIRETARLLGLDADRVNEIFCSSFSKVEEIAGYLNLRVDSNEDVLEVMEKANHALARMNGSLQVNLAKAIGLASEVEAPDCVRAPEAIEDKKETIRNVLDAVAHEIRNPLMAIGGFAQRLANNLDGKDDLYNYASIIVKESGRLQQVMNEITAFSSAYKPSRFRFNLVETLDEVIGELESLPDVKSTEVIRNYTRDPVFIAIDQEAIMGALKRLLHAIIQMSKKAGDARIWIEIPPLQATNQVSIAIYSKGWDLPGDVLSMLSGLDFSSKTLGLGFSLLQAWKILEAHNGHIEMKSEDDTNYFIISLPLDF
jgi:HD-like signal output (HDOD) protein/nitrogen-specific signal transduction histidine kinase